MTRIRSVLVVALVGAGCTGGGGGGGGGATVTIDSAQCSVTTPGTSSDSGAVVASGTASGPVGTRFQFSIANGGDTGLTIDCGGWDQQGTLANSTQCINNGGPDAISWTVTQSVYWCLTGCDPSTATNNADDPNKHLTAEVYDTSVTILAQQDQDVTCQ